MDSRNLIPKWVPSFENEFPELMSFEKSVVLQTGQSEERQVSGIAYRTKGKLLICEKAKLLDKTSIFWSNEKTR